MFSYTFTCEELQDNGDIVKDLVLTSLVSEGLLDSDVAETYSRTHACMVRRPSKVSQYFKKYFEKNDEPKIFIGKIFDLIVDDGC